MSSSSTERDPTANEHVEASDDLRKVPSKDSSSEPSNALLGNLAERKHKPVRLPTSGLFDYSDGTL
jgi:hypothetical protein